MRGERRPEAHRGGGIARADDDRAVTAANQVAGGRTEEGPLEPATCRCTYDHHGGSFAPGARGQRGTWCAAQQADSPHPRSGDACRTRHPVDDAAAGRPVLHRSARNCCGRRGLSTGGTLGHRYRRHHVNQDQWQTKAPGKGAGDRDALGVVLVLHAADHAGGRPPPRARRLPGEDDGGSGGRHVRPQRDRSNRQRGVDIEPRPRQIHGPKA